MDALDAWVDGRQMDTWMCGWMGEWVKMNEFAILDVSDQVLFLRGHKLAESHGDRIS